MLLQGERTQSERWMDKVEKAEGVNRKFWSAYKSDSAHAGDLLKVGGAQTPNFSFLITLVTVDPASLWTSRWSRASHLSVEPPSRVNFSPSFSFLRPPHTNNRSTRKGKEKKKTRPVVSTSGCGEKWHARDSEVTKKSWQNEKRCWMITAKGENY